MSSKNKKKKKSSGQKPPPSQTQSAQPQSQSQSQTAAVSSSKPGTVQNATVSSQKSPPASSQKATVSRTNKTAEPTPFPQRLLGVITLKAPIYREIADDQSATIQAGIIVVVVALVVGAIAAFGARIEIPGAPPTPNNPIARAIVMVIQELLFWFVGAAVIAGVAKNLFQGKTDVGEMLRVFGFAQVFEILFVLGVFGSTVAAIASIAGLILSIIGSVIGIREAAGFTTGRAAIAGVFAIVLVAILLAFFTAFVLNPLVTTLLPT